MTSENKNLIKAKRFEPTEVEPVTYKGIKYIAPHFKITANQIHRGFIEAWDVKTNKKLWDLQVYKITYDPKLEQDVQDVFIASLKVDKNHIVVVNELDEMYQVNLQTKNIMKIN